MFHNIGKAANLYTLCVYGGVPYDTQEGALSRGVDVVIGTPGRIKDLLERGSLKLDSLKFRVLDEVDQMLAMGFIEDVELILGVGTALTHGSCTYTRCHAYGALRVVE